MQLRHLHSFLTIVEAGTLTAAAERLFKSQAAVSHDLKSLEQGLGVRLLERDSHRVALTREGAALLPHAEGLLAGAAVAEAEMRDFSLGRRAVVRIGCLPSLTRYAGDVIKRFREEELGTTVRLTTNRPESLVDLLAAGRLDLVVSESAVRQGIESTPLGHEALQIALPVGDPAAGGPISSAELRRRDFVGFNRDLETPHLTERFFAIHGGYPEPAVEATDVWQILELVGAGMGYSLLPASVIARSAAVVGVDPDPPAVREISILSRRRDPVPPRAGRLRELFGELAASGGRFGRAAAPPG